MMNRFNTEMARRDFLLGTAAASGALLCPTLARATEQVAVVDATITKIYVIFKTHLDIGFTDLAANVFHRYMNNYIPKAIQVGQTIRKSRPKDSFKWTTGSWLIYKYLEEANATARRELEQGIADGYIWWHRPTEPS